MGAVERLTRKRSGAPPINTQETREAEESAPATQSAAERIMWTQQTFGNRFVQHRASSCPDLSRCPTGGACEKCQQQQVQTKHVGERTKDDEENEDGDIEDRVSQMPEEKTACAACEDEEEQSAGIESTKFSTGAATNFSVGTAPPPSSSASVEAPQPTSLTTPQSSSGSEPQRTSAAATGREAVGANVTESNDSMSGSQAVAASASNASTPQPIRSVATPSPSTSTAERPSAPAQQPTHDNEPQPTTVTNRGATAASVGSGESVVQGNGGTNARTGETNSGTDGGTNARTGEADAGTERRTAAADKYAEAVDSLSTARSLIVEDSATEVAPGQMRRSEFISEVQVAVRETAEEALEGSCRSAKDCPYIDYWVNHYRTKDSQYIRRALRKYVPASEHAATASEAIDYIREHVRRAVEIWVATGKVTGVPEGVPMNVPGAPPVEGSKSTTSRRNNLFFKGRDGGAKEADDPRAIQSRLGSGRPLEGGVKSRMESAFGQDFSAVRVHTDAAASDLSATQNARAFTVGEDVAFGSGEYQPGTPVGDALLAHELAHVVQQGGAVESEEPLRKDETEHGAMEEDADNSAVGAVVSMWSGMKGGLADVGRSAMPRLKSGLSLQRCSTKKCKVKSGPTYTPSGTITPTLSGGLKTAHFDMAAEFEHDPSNDIAASCCEIRQYMQWSTGETPPNHAGWRPASDFSAETWYEDRDAADKRYGHRSGTYSDCRAPLDQYLNSAGDLKCGTGHIFKGSDDPGGASSRTGEWRFMLKVVDVCNSEADVGTASNVTVDF